jgi:hypothetical protein
MANDDYDNAKTDKEALRKCQELHTHTPEPWRQTTFAVMAGRDDTDDFCYVGRCDMEDDFHLNTTNARRIVACVNACAGASTKTLEALKPGELGKLLEELGDIAGVDK